MGNLSSYQEIEKQERAIRLFRQNYKGDLSCNGKYTNKQINGKLRRLYNGYTGDKYKNDFILDSDCKWKKHATFYLNKKKFN